MFHRARLMNYREKYIVLRDAYLSNADFIRPPNTQIDIHRCAFHSRYWTILPGASDYRCEEHGATFHEKTNEILGRKLQAYPETLRHADVDLLENRDFTYTLFRKRSDNPETGVVFIFHGLNERSWSKYLPWAERIVELTGKAAILFPIAFHMNRAPSAWGESRTMNSVATARKNYSPSIMNSSFANAAISSRIELIPQRFFWSGLQTFDDIVSFISEIRKGLNPHIRADATIDLFGYSIGSFLSEILIMANPYNYFDKSRLFLFCGGPTLDRMSPNSRFILDSDATIAIYSYFTERLESELSLDHRIAHYFSDAHPAGTIFKAMLSYQKKKQLREELFRKLQLRLFAVALTKDSVVPPAEVLNALKGEYRDIGIPVKILDFPYPYAHVNPFPTEEKIASEVTAEFDKVFEFAADHLS